MGCEILDNYLDIVAVSSSRFLGFHSATHVYNHASEKKTMFGVELQQFYFHKPIFSQMIRQTTLHGGNSIIRATATTTVSQHERQ